MPEPVPLRAALRVEAPLAFGESLVPAIRDASASVVDASHLVVVRVLQRRLVDRLLLQQLSGEPRLRGTRHGPAGGQSISNKGVAA